MGPTTFSKPVMEVVIMVLRSTECIVEAPGLMVSPKRMELPSGDQFTPATLSFPDV
jgi:hypothetical protein